MANIVNIVEQYRIRYFGQSVSGTPNLKVCLYLYGTGHPSGVVGVINFYPPEVLPAKQDCLDGLGRPQGNMSVTEIGSITDMLRNEKPIYIHWSEGFKQVWLDTSAEPVGENED